MGRQRLPLVLLCTAALFLCGCTTITPLTAPQPLNTEPRNFSHAAFDRVLQQFVNNQGQVDYATLKKHSIDLDRYYTLVSDYSPDSHPALFPTGQSRLAYWLNAYNAVVIKTVLTHYPVGSVTDIHPPFPLSWLLPSNSGFFLLQRVTLGGTTTNLYYLEHRVIRKRFVDPRVHFALNCASGGCPRLPMMAFTADELNAQLDREARRFLAEERNLRIDHEEKTVFLSSIFDWYENDFLQWYKQRFPDQRATLLRYAALYLPAHRAEELQRATSYRVHFVPYDWSLNDQRRRGGCCGVFLRNR